MIVAHVGPGPGRQGGPAGYLAQLQTAFAAGTGVHRVLFSPRVPDHRPQAARPRTALGGALTLLRRARRTWFGAPRQHREAMAGLGAPGGVIHRQVQVAWEGLQASAAASLDQAAEARADVWFAHDAATAEAALARRGSGAEVWLLLHNPMPFGLYLAWCWGVPEAAWDEVWQWADVQAWAARERQVIRRVDRLFVPTREAAGELARVDNALADVLAEATPLLTGAAAPARRWPGASVATLRRHWGLPVDDPVALFLGNAQPYRGIDLLLAALPQLDRAVAGVVAVAGIEMDALPFHPRLRALGAVHEVSDLLAAVDLVVNVNRFSLFDLSTIEACEAGKPLLLSPVGGHASFRDLGAGCRLLPSLDPPAVAAALSSMFATAAEARAALGARSRACYEAHLTPALLRQRHLALYDAAAARAARPA